jgi:oxygen-independent coproporphyrinogen-3 oxidase
MVAQVGPDPATTGTELRETSVGSVFVSNYPPYSFWSPEHLGALDVALHSEPRPDVPMGLYIHIPFCRKRCKFCYFKVYTDKNAAQVERYIGALDAELKAYKDLPAVRGRSLEFVYFGGGTPSFISAKHLASLADRLKKSIPWTGVKEVAFECEPGTLSRTKLEAIKEIGVTRLSLGVESFDDAILEMNGRAHVSKEIERVRPWIQEIGFDLVNIDIIAGMIGETEAGWHDTVRKAIDFGADSVTVYQMEVPYNTAFSKQLRDGSLDVPLADWDTKRAWNNYALEQLESAGYSLSSAYTMIREGGPDQSFVYRDALWHGSDMLSTGVASFGHMSGVHYQNAGGWSDYLEAVEAGNLPLQRAFPTSPDERLTREMILQLKVGALQPEYFVSKFGVDIRDRFAAAFDELRRKNFLRMDNGTITLTRNGLLRVDSLLPSFYAPEYQGSRYS